MLGKMKTGLIEHKTNLRFKNMDNFESFINAVEIDYESHDVIFTGYIQKFTTHPFNAVKRSSYGEGTNYMNEIVERYGQNVFSPTSGSCFIQCNNYYTNNEYTEEFKNFIRNEKYRAAVMTSARIQQIFFKKY